jgi:hypothetical protein
LNAIYIKGKYNENGRNIHKKVCLRINTMLLLSRGALDILPKNTAKSANIFYTP